MLISSKTRDKRVKIGGQCLQESKKNIDKILFFSFYFKFFCIFVREQIPLNYDTT